MDLRLALGRSASEAVTLVSRVYLCALPELTGDFHMEFLSFKTYDRHFETLVEIRSSPAAFCEAGRKCSLQLPYRRACQKPHCFSTRVLGEPEVSEDHDGIGRPKASNIRDHFAAWCLGARGPRSITSGVTCSICCSFCMLRFVSRGLYIAADREWVRQAFGWRRRWKNGFAAASRLLSRFTLLLHSSALGHAGVVRRYIMTLRQLKLMSAKYHCGHQCLRCCETFDSNNASRGVASCFCESTPHSHSVPSTSYAHQC